MREPTKSSADPLRLNEAAVKIRYLSSMNTIQEGVQMVTEFFDMVMKAIPGKNAAADDILPVVCDGMSRCARLSSQVVSSFQYLADVWPTEGLDEKVTYVLVTCSIAATHFASGTTENQRLPEMQTTRKIDVDPQQTKDTIEMLESLLQDV
jgi:hypothetical protein